MVMRKKMRKWNGNNQGRRFSQNADGRFLKILSLFKGDNLKELKGLRVSMSKMWLSPFMKLKSSI